MKDQLFRKRQDVIEFVTETDNTFISSMPDTRKFTRLMLPGEVDGKIPAMTMRYVFQNDQGALFKASILPPWGKYTCGDLFNLMLQAGGLENLFYRSMKIFSDKTVPFTEGQQACLIRNGVVDTVVYKDPSQIHSNLWALIEGDHTEVFPLACDPITLKTGHTMMFFNSRTVEFYAEPYP